MRLGERVAREARSWVDTAFVWGQSVKGEGCDCKGLIIGVARELGRAEADSLYAAVTDYRVDRPVPTAFLIEGVEALFDRVTDMRAGDVLLLNHAGRPGHLAIYVGDDRIVHAFPGVKAKVSERDLRVLTHKFPLHSIWRWRPTR